MEPDYTQVLYSILVGLFSSLFSIFTIIICIYYIVKMGSKIEGTLMIIASSISLLCSIATQIGVLYIKTWGTNDYLHFTYIIQGFAFLGSLLFIIGFFILIRKVIHYKSLISKN